MIIIGIIGAPRARFFPYRDDMQHPVALQNNYVAEQGNFAELIKRGRILYFGVAVMKTFGRMRRKNLPKGTRLSPTFASFSPFFLDLGSLINLFPKRTLQGGGTDG